MRGIQEGRSGNAQGILFLKQVAVRTCSFQAQGLIVQSVNKKPIWFDMAVTGVLPISGQGMLPVPRLKRSVFCEKGDNLFEFIQILSSFSNPFQIS